MPAGELTSLATKVNQPDQNSVLFVCLPRPHCAKKGNLQKMYQQYRPRRMLSLASMPLAQSAWPLYMFADHLSLSLKNNRFKPATGSRESPLDPVPFPHSTSPCVREHAPHFVLPLCSDQGFAPGFPAVLCCHVQCLCPRGVPGPGKQGKCLYRLTFLFFAC